MRKYIANLQGGLDSNSAGLCWGRGSCSLSITVSKSARRCCQGWPKKEVVGKSAISSQIRLNWSIFAFSIKVGITSAIPITWEHNTWHNTATSDSATPLGVPTPKNRNFLLLIGGASCSWSASPGGVWNYLTSGEPHFQAESEYESFVFLATAVHAK